MLYSAEDRYTWVLSAGGNVRVTTDDPNGEMFKPGDDLPDEDFQVTVIDLQDKSAVDDDDLARVAALTELYAIRLTGTSVTDAGIKHLAGLKKLIGVTLDGTKVTEAGVAELKNSLPNCRVVK